MKSVHARFEAIRRTLDAQLDDFRERRAVAGTEEARRSPPSLRFDTEDAANDTADSDPESSVGVGPYLRSASEPTPTEPSPPPMTGASPAPYLRNSWLARASE